MNYTVRELKLAYYCHEETNGSNLLTQSPKKSIKIHMSVTSNKISEINTVQVSVMITHIVKKSQFSGLRGTVTGHCIENRMYLYPIPIGNYFLKK